tara:strand:- start:600 stop:1217 length:618 start_codon:yes stop_codon:yes gene_type:complete
MSTLQVNTINESTSTSGVTIDGVLIKDGLVDGKDVSALVPGGLVKLASTDFSDVSSVVFDDVFTSTYNNYAFKIYHQAADNNTEFRFRFRTGSGDETTAQYNVVNVISFPNSSTNWAAKTIYGLDINAFTMNGGMANNKIYHSSLDMFSPQLAQDTTWSGTAGYQGGHVFVIGGAMEVDTQYTGIKFYQSTGNITGSIQIYGYAT